MATAKSRSKAETPPAAIGAATGEVQEILTRLDTVTITAPLAEERPMGQHARRHFDLQLKRGHAVTLQRFTDGLIAAGATLADGSRVTNGTDAMRWVLDGLAGASATSAGSAE